MASNGFQWLPFNQPLKREERGGLGMFLCRRADGWRTGDLGIVPLRGRQPGSPGAISAERRGWEIIPEWI